MPNPPLVIRGKWRGKEYRVLRELGRGTGGIVYEVSHAQRNFALKVGHDSFTLTSEINVLKLLQKAEGTVLGPSLYDVDDWVSPSGVRSFYVMNVIKGVPVHHYVRNQGEEWLPVLVMQLLGFLDQLHKRGYVFGDLKPEHLLVTGSPPRLVWFDAGGMTPIGRAVKEYTELYDRGYWQMGDRRANPEYDLFSTSLMILHMAQGKPVTLQQDPLTTFIHQMERTPLLTPYRTVLKNAFLGRYPSAQAMKKDWFIAWQKDRFPGKTRRAPFSQPGNTSPSRRTTANKPKKGWRLLVKVFKIILFLILSSFLSLLAALYLIYQVL